jgi:hypothetical protein
MILALTVSKSDPPAEAVLAGPIARSLVVVELLLVLVLLQLREKLVPGERLPDEHDVVAGCVRLVFGLRPDEADGHDPPPSSEGS